MHFAEQDAWNLPTNKKSSFSAKPSSSGEPSALLEIESHSMYSALRGGGCNTLQILTVSLIFKFGSSGYKSSRFFFNQTVKWKKKNKLLPLTDSVFLFEQNLQHETVPE